MIDDIPVKQRINFSLILARWLITTTCHKKVVIYGAGKITKALIELFKKHNYPMPSEIWDDKPSDNTIYDIPILTTPSSVREDVNAIVLGTDTWQRDMRARLQTIGYAKIPVIDLFKDMELQEKPILIRAIANKKLLNKVVLAFRIVSKSISLFMDVIKKKEHIWIINDRTDLKRASDKSIYMAAKYDGNATIISGPYAIIPALFARLVVFHAIATILLHNAPYVAFRLRYFLKRPVVFYTHSNMTEFEIMNELAPKRWNEFMNKAKVHGIIKLLCASSRSADEFKKRLERNDDFTSVIYETNEPPSVALEKKNDGDGIREIVTIATIQPTKGTDIWLHAAIELCKKYDNLRFAWYGRPVWDTDYFIYLRQELLESGLEDKIIFTGHSENPWEQAKNADLYVVASRNDACPLGPIEAMSLGKTVIGFDVDAIPEEIGDTGIVVKELSHKALAQAIEEAMLKRKKGVLPAYNKKAVERYQEMFAPQVFAKKLRMETEKMSKDAS
jgi:glycosyltransferase involved in cell wall biosynthesis